MDKYNFPLTGILSKGQLIEIGWAESSEFDKITKIRNSERVRNSFLDNRLLDETTNRKWIVSGMNKPIEALLSIRWSKNNLFLGTCGWSDWDREKKTVWLGRLALDSIAVKKVINQFPSDYLGPIIDATITLRNFAFIKLGVEEAHTFHIKGNSLSEKIIKFNGFIEKDCELRTRPNGEQAETINMFLTKVRWQKLYSEN